MYCTSCGQLVGAEAAYCPHCGGVQPGIRPHRRLYRPLQGRKIAGVCLGVAQYLELDATLVRVVWLLVALLGGGGVLAYLIAWLIMPCEEDLQALYPVAAINRTPKA
jgi:phage shock protein PspC (stress-responsive transcriptional regulator)